MNTILDFVQGQITVENGATTATIAGANSDFFDRGTALFTTGNLPVAVQRGASANEIRLLRPWPFVSVTDEPFVAFNTIEGLVSALREARETSEDLNQILFSLDDVLTSTDPEVIIDLSGGDLSVTPWGFIRQTVDEQLNQWNLTIINADPRRKAVEDASGGKNTVVYDAQGNPNVMVVVPRFNVEDLGLTELDLGSGTHPAFQTNGAPRSEILIAKYLASSAAGGTAVVGGVQPRVSVNFDTAKDFCTRKGDNWHLMSIHEWAAIALWSLANGTVPRGNTNYGRSHENNWETAPRADGGIPGDTAGTACTDTGKGPAAWGHDHTDFGIQDLVGNVWEWIDQMKLQDGRIITTLDNNPAVAEANWTPHQAYYDSTSETGGSPILNSTVTNRMGDLGDDANTGNSNSIDFSALTKDPSYTPLQLLRQLLLETATDQTVGGRLYTRNYGERLPLRGGSWSLGSAAGLGALSLHRSRSSSSSSIGFRPAFFV